jgi:uncharacterized protein YkwD
MTAKPILLLLGLCTILSAQTESFAQRIFERINELRVASGIEKLVWSEPLAQRAQEQSIRKAALGFSGHSDPAYGGVAQRLQMAGIRWQRCGENIFSERGWDDPVNYAVVFWWYSPGHKANMLNEDFTQTGIGESQAADGTWIITQIFVQPPPVKAVESRLR